MCCMGRVRFRHADVFFMFVPCVHPVSVLNAAFCITCSLLILIEDARGDHIENKLWKRHTPEPVTRLPCR